MTLDVERARRSFPSLERGFAYMDNAGGSQCLGAVADAVRDYLVACNVQLGATYADSVEASRRVLEGRRALARLVRATDDRQVVLGGSTTQLVANLASAMPLAPGDEVVVTNADHEANIGPFRRLASRGIVVREWRLDRDALELRPRDLEPLLGPRTRLVCMTHCSNVLGTIHDVPAVARLVHAAGARLLVDGVAYAPHRRVDPAALGADFYVFSLYKTYGPHQAALVAPVEQLAKLACINHAFLADEIPYKLQPGNVCYELVAALPAIERYLVELAPSGAGDAVDRAWTAIAEHEAALSERLLGFLRARRDLTLIGSSSARPERAPTVSFVPRGKAPADVVRALDARGIGARHGSFYAPRLIEWLGLPETGVVRVSLVHYNTLEEVDRLVAALDAIL